MKEPVISREVAEQELERAIDIFDGDIKSDDDRNNIIAAVMAGRVNIDEAKGTLEYTFAVPLEQKSGDSVKSVTLREPDSADLEYINKGQRVTVSADGTATMDLSDLYVKTTRMLTRMSGLPVALCDRIKRRDMAVLNSLCNFFG